MTDLIKPHKSLTLRRVVRAVEASLFGTVSNPGFCLACGEACDDCEPDTVMRGCRHCCAARVCSATYVLTSMPLVSYGPDSRAYDAIRRGAK